MLEDDAQYAENIKDITIFPPNNASSDLTDEDSGDEDVVNINNLPASQLQAPAEIAFLDADNEFSSEDELPLSAFVSPPSTSKSIQSCKGKNVAKKRKKYNWVKEDLPISQVQEVVSLEEMEISENPLQLFEKFFDEELINLIVAESNRYAQKRNRKNNIEHAEVKCFVGVLLLSGYLQVPRRRLFWEKERDCHNNLVSEAISRDKFEHILSNFHLVDNEKLDKEDKFCKVRPLFTHLNKKFIEHSFTEENHSVDEAMVPYYGRHGCKQYIHGKPIRYGYKLWVGTTRLGYINWFEPYQGSATKVSKTYLEYGVGSGVVLQYAEVLHKRWPNICIHLFFDNFFTSLPLMEELSDKGFQATGTVRENRLPGNPLVDSAILKKRQRGEYDYAKIQEKNIIAVKWHDNNIVCVSSNCAGIAPVHRVKRYSQKEKKIIQVKYKNKINIFCYIFYLF